MVLRCSGKRIGQFDESFDTDISQIGASDEKTRGSEREQCMFDDEPVVAFSDGLEIFCTVNIH